MVCDVGKSGGTDAAAKACRAQQDASTAHAAASPGAQRRAAPAPTAGTGGRRKRERRNFSTSVGVLRPFLYAVGTTERSDPDVFDSATVADSDDRTLQDRLSRLDVAKQQMEKRISTWPLWKVERSFSWRAFKRDEAQ